MALRKLLTISLICILAGSICIAAPEKVDLKLRLQTGETHQMKITNDMSITQTMAGQENKIKQLQEMVCSFTVLSKDANGNMDIEFVYDSVKMTMDSPMGKMTFDSANPPKADANNANPMEEMFGKIFSAMVGSKFQMMTRPTGETYNVRGFGEMMKKFKDAIGNGPQAQAGGEFFDKMFNEEKIKEMAGSMMIVFPAEPVAVGDTWYDKLNLDMGFPIDTDTTYMFTKSENGYAYIDAMAKLDMGDTGSVIEAGGVKTSIQMSGVLNTAISVDQTTGLVHKSTGVMNFTGMVKMEPNAQMPEGMTMPMTISGTSTTELIK